MSQVGKAAPRNHDHDTPWQQRNYQVLPNSDCLKWALEFACAACSCSKMSNASMGSSRNHATSWASPLLPQFVLAQETIFDFWNIQMVKQIADFLVPGRRVGPLIWHETQQLDSCNFPNVVLVKWSKPWYPGEHQNRWKLWMFTPPNMYTYNIYILIYIFLSQVFNGFKMFQAIPKSERHLCLDRRKRPSLKRRLASASSPSHIGGTIQSTVSKMVNNF